MTKLLIVDDEAWIRERLRDTINWGEIGIQVIGEASDGEEALQLAEKLCPDIIITDIRMPCINGLELIKKLKDNKSKAKVIIISGYSDFEYAQQAVKFGAFDYILKPVEDDNLINTVEKCLEQIALDKKMDDLIEIANRQIKERMTLLKEKFYYNLVNEYFTQEEDILKRLDYLGINYRSSYNLCFIIQIDEQKNKADSEWDKHLLDFITANIAGDFINKVGEGDTFYLLSGEVICLVFSDADEDKLVHQVMSISTGIQKTLKKLTGYSTTIGIGRAYSSLLKLSDSYREAREALQYKFYLGNDKIYEIKSIKIEHKPNHYKLNDIEVLLNNIKMGNKEKALSTLNKMFKDIFREENDITPVNLKFIYIDIVNSVFKTILETNSSINDFSDFSIEFLEQINKLQTVDEIYDCLTDTITRIIQFHSQFKNTKRRKVIDKAIDYISKHYHEPLTLNQLSEILYFNASYFCKIFKEETGKSFTKYLINYRMQKAKELLADVTLKVYEVGEKVGYEDAQYFTKIFKTTQGVTPIQYREKISKT